MTKSEAPQLTTRTALCWILGCVIAAHGLLPFSTVIVSDDWFTLLAYREASLEAAWKGAVFLSMPLTVVQALPFFAIGDNVFLLRTVNFLVILASGWVFFLVLARLRPESRREALWIALFAVAFPGYRVHFMVSFLFYTLGLLLFLFALWLVLCAEDTARPSARRWRLAVAAALVFYSFHFSALLVFYVFFVACHFGYFRMCRSASWGRAAVDFVASRYLFLLLPLWFWGMRQATGLILPTWSQYNRPRLDGEMINRGLAAFWDAYCRMAVELTGSVWFWAGLAVLLALAFVRSSRRVTAQRSWGDLAGVLLGTGMLLAGILPFVLVGKFPLLGPIDGRSRSGFGFATEQILVEIDSRMHLFLGVAVGFILVYAARGLVGLLRWPATTVRAILFALLGAAIVVNVTSYAAMEKKAIVMAGVREHMRATPTLKNYGIIGVVDRIGNVSTTWDSWVLFLETVWGDRAHHGVPERWYGSELNASIVYNRDTIINHRLYGGAWYRYMVKPPPFSPQATVVLSHGKAFSQYSDIGATLRYWGLKLFAPKKALAFAKQFAAIDLIPKINIEKMLQEEQFGRNWLPLLSAGTGDDISPGQAQNPSEAPRVALRLTSEAGRYLYLEIEAADLGDFASQLQVVDVAEGALPMVCVPFGARLRALVLLPRTGAEVMVVHRSRKLGTWQIVQAMQQPAGERLKFALLPEPFIEPSDLFPNVYRGVYDVELTQMPAVLWPTKPDHAWPEFSRENKVARFIPRNHGDAVSTDSIDIPGQGPVFARVEWPEKWEGEPALIRIEDADGHRLLDVPDPHSGQTSQEQNRARIFQVPLRDENRRVVILFVSRSRGTVVLPKRVSLVQTDPVATLTRSIEDYFPITSTVPGHE